MNQQNMTKKSDYEAVAMRVSIVTLIINMLLSLLKLLAGIIAHSGAMISDAVHSASDVFSTIIVMIGIKISHKKADKEHPYGHERLECVASILLAVMLALVGAGIGYSGIMTVVEGKEIQTPGILALIAAIVSIVVKECMYQYTVRAGKKINSTALKADAMHHRSDALSSIGALIGILGARLGLPVLEPIASVVIAAFIVKAAWDIFKESIDKMIDRSCDDEALEKIKETIFSVDGVLNIDDIKTRMFGARLFIDVEIALNKNLTLHEAHRISEIVQKRVEEEHPDVKHCMVHQNPFLDE